MFLAWNGLSFAWSEHPAAALDALSRLALNAILFLIVFTAIRTERDVMQGLLVLHRRRSLATIVGVLTGSGPTPYGEAARISTGSDNSNELAAVLVASRPARWDSRWSLDVPPPCEPRPSGPPRSHWPASS